MEDMFKDKKEITNTPICFVFHSSDLYMNVWWTTNLVILIFLTNFTLVLVQAFVQRCAFLNIYLGNSRLHSLLFVLSA